MNFIIRSEYHMTNRIHEMNPRWELFQPERLQRLTPISFEGQAWAGRQDEKTRGPELRPRVEQIEMFESDAKLTCR
jgi:hypothetical protein